jgi:putative ATP-dependent DNA ligase
MSTESPPLPEPARAALERGKARWESFGELRYLRLTDSHQGYAKGTVCFGTRLVAGYPHIGRIFRLEQGLRQQFVGPFWVEEKMDGYNVRVVRVGEQVLALTRGGYVCPFTTDRLADLLDLRLFEREPDLVVCIEVVGPDNPYSLGGPAFISQDVQAYLIDLLPIGSNVFLPVEHKLALAEAQGLPLARVLGRFSANQWRAVQALVQELDRDGREGVVLKADAPGGHRTKCVTQFSGIYDIGVRASDVVELPGDFFTGRVLRLALGMDEEGREPDEELQRRLGAALLNGLFESLERFKREGRVAHTFRCRFRSRGNAESFLVHLREILGHTHLRQRRLEPDGDLWLLEFDKEVPKMTGLLHQLFRGEALID